MGLLDWLKGKPATPAATAAKPAAAPAASVPNRTAATATPAAPAAKPVTPAAAPAASVVHPAAPAVNQAQTAPQQSQSQVLKPAASYNTPAASAPYTPAASAPHIAPVSSAAPISSAIPNAAPAPVLHAAPAATVAPTGELQVVIGTAPVKFTTGKPYLEGSAVMVPIRELAEHLGANADWNDKTRTSTLWKDDDRVELTIGSTTAKVNGKVVSTGAPPVVREDRMYMPIQFLAEALDVKYSYDAAKKIATIS